MISEFYLVFAGTQGIKNIQNEINILIEQAEQELTIFSNYKLLKRIFDPNMLINLNNKFQNNIVSKILEDNYDRHIRNQIEGLNNNKRTSLIQLEYADRLGEFNEMIICFNGKYILQIQQDNDDSFVGTFTNDSNKVLVPQI